jgi:hypothetical protein
VVVLVGVVIGYGVVRRALTIRAIERHERQWAREGPSDYTFHLELRCFCAQRQFDLTVAEGRVTHVEPVTKVGDLPTIDDLYDIARDAGHDRAHSVRVRYDRHDGHPTSVSIDESRSVADDEIEYVVTNLRSTEGA